MDAQRLSGVSFSFDISIKLSRETDVDDDDVTSKIYSSNKNHKIYYNFREGPRKSNFRIVRTIDCIYYFKSMVRTLKIRREPWSSG